MPEAQYARRAETDHTQASPQTPARTQRHAQRIADASLIPLYAQAWGNQLPPHLRLPVQLVQAYAEHTLQAGADPWLRHAQQTRTLPTIGSQPIQRMRIDLNDEIEIESRDYTKDALLALIGNFPQAEGQIREAIERGEFKLPAFVTPLFRGVHYRDEGMKAAYDQASGVGSTLYAPASGSNAQQSTAIVQGWQDLQRITRESREFPAYVGTYYHQGQNLYEVLANLYVNNYNAFTAILPKLLAAFPALQRAENPFLSMAERAHISHGYAQHEGKKNKEQAGTLGGVVHGLAVPVSYQQSTPTWVNIPSAHATGGAVIKVRHLPQSEHLAVGSLPGQYNLLAWPVATGEDEKAMAKRALEEGGDMDLDLRAKIEERGDVVAYHRPASNPQASHLYFDRPPYTTDLERKSAFPLFEQTYKEKTRLQRLIGKAIKELQAKESEFQETKQERKAERLYTECVEYVEHIESLFPKYKQLCIQLVQFEGQEKFPPRIREEKRTKAWEEYPPLYTPEELAERDKYHDPSDEMLLNGPMSEIKTLLIEYLKLKSYFMPK